MIGSRNVFSPLNTPAMKVPSGLVSARTTARNNAICRQPFAVMVKTSPATARPSPDSRRPEYKPKAAEHYPALLRTSLLEPLAAAHVGDRHQKEGNDCCDEQEVVHPNFLSILRKLSLSGIPQSMRPFETSQGAPYILKLTANVSLFSCLDTSGKKTPGVP